MKKNEFKCAMCGNIYEKARSDKEAYQECVDNFGKQMIDYTELDIICDDCYQEIKPSEHQEEYLGAMEEWKETWNRALKEVKTRCLNLKKFD